MNDWTGTVRCKYCGYAKLRWEEGENGKWYLLTPNGSGHFCKPEKKHAKYQRNH